MAAEVVLVVGFLSILGACVAVLVWDIKRRRLGREEDAGVSADLKLRIAELEKENQRLREEIGFLEELSHKNRGPHSTGT